AEAQHPSVKDAQRELAAAERALQQREAAYAPNVTLRADGLSLRIEPDGDTVTGRPGLAVSAGLKMPTGLQLSASVSAQQSRAATQDANVRGTVSLSYPLLRSASLDADALALREAALAVDAARRRLEVVRQQARAQVLSALRDAEVAKARLELAQE